MSTPTDNDQRSKIDRGYERGSGAYLQDAENAYAQAGIDQAEAFANDPNNATRSAVEAQEKDGNVPNPINFTGGGKQKVSGKAWFKKKGALSAIFALILGGGASLTMLGSPALLIVHFKEIMFEKFNTQLASMDARTTRVMSAKITSTTSGHCGATITIRCKFTSMSDRQVAQFKEAGIEVESNKTTAIRGRTVPESFKFNGKTISAKDFNTEIINNQDFKTAVKKGYNPRFATTTGRAWDWVAKKMGLSKKPPFEEGDTDEERAKKLQETVKNGAQSEPLKPLSVGEEDENGKVATQADVDARATAISEQAKIQADLDKGLKVGDAALDNAGKFASGAADAAINVFKLTGTVDMGCSAYNAIRAVGYAAKTVRAIQLARYAMTFLSVADMIKAGKAKPEDVAYIGGILTEVTYDATSAARRVKKASATDSAGFKYAAYGDTSGFKSNNFVSQFMAGGGLTGDLINFSNTAATLAGAGDPKNAKAVCATLANPWVQAGSLVGGIALMLTGVGTVAQITKAAASAIPGIALQIGLAVLPDLLKDIVAGSVTDGIKGQDSGDATASGSGSMLGLAGNANGNASMTKDDALAYTNLQSETLAKYAEEDRQTLSPLDPTNKNTFMGSIVSTMLPYTTNLATPSTILGSTGSFLSNSFANLIPKTSALTTEQHKQALDMCTDPDYKDMDIATDPFCNVIYGIPPKYLNKDPLAVIDELGDANIDPTTGEPKGAYKTFIERCILRGEPLGSDKDGAEGDGSDCKINDSNANYYVHYLDTNINDGIDNGYDTGSSDSNPSDSTAENSGNVNTNGWSYPTIPNSPVVSGFGSRVINGNVSYHTGVDFGVPSGSPFYATRDGVVEAREYNIYSINGGAWCPVTPSESPIQKDIWITHNVDGEKYVSIYSHMSKYLKKTGDVVKAGDLIGYTGGSGCSSGPHVHFEIWKGSPNPGVPGPGALNPLPLISGGN